jgi:hypothetical protein
MLPRDPMYLPRIGKQNQRQRCSDGMEDRLHANTDASTKLYLIRIEPSHRHPFLSVSGAKRPKQTGSYVVSILSASSKINQVECKRNHVTCLLKRYVGSSYLSWTYKFRASRLRETSSFSPKTLLSFCLVVLSITYRQDGVFHQCLSPKQERDRYWPSILH